MQIISNASMSMPAQASAPASARARSGGKRRRQMKGCRGSESPDDISLSSCDLSGEADEDQRAADEDVCVSSRTEETPHANARSLARPPARSNWCCCATHSRAYIARQAAEGGDTRGFLNKQFFIFPFMHPDGFNSQHVIMPTVLKHVSQPWRGGSGCFRTCCPVSELSV